MCCQTWGRQDERKTHELEESSKCLSPDVKENPTSRKILIRKNAHLCTCTIYLLFTTMVSHEPDHPAPVLDLDEIIAALDCEEAAPVLDLNEIIASLSLDDSPPPSGSTRVAPITPPPRYSALPGTPAAVPGPSTPPSTSQTVYSFRSPGRSAISSNWSEAGAATQGSSHSQVRAIRKSHTRRPSPQAYTIFRGLATGVFDSWFVPI